MPWRTLMGLYAFPATLVCLMSFIRCKSFYFCCFIFILCYLFGIQFFSFFPSLSLFSVHSFHFSFIRQAIFVGNLFVGFRFWFHREPVSLLLKRPPDCFVWFLRGWIFLASAHCCTSIYLPFLYLTSRVLLFFFDFLIFLNLFLLFPKTACISHATVNKFRIERKKGIYHAVVDTECWCVARVWFLL